MCVSARAEHLCPFKESKASHGLLYPVYPQDNLLFIKICPKAKPQGANSSLL